MRWVRSTWFWIVLLALLAFAIRLPYWRTMPGDYDEINQMVFAWRIVTGASLPLTGNDAYTGPFFSYLIALCIALGAREPFIGRIIVLLAGTLTVPLAYLWVQALRRMAGLQPGRIAALLAAALVAFNAHLVLLNSHIGGATYTLPFFTMSFLWLSTEAVNRAKLRWWLLAWVAAGFALQANPIAIFLLMGCGAALLMVIIAGTSPISNQMRTASWAAMGALVVVLAYSPVLVSNVLRTARSLDVALARDYLWQPNPTLTTYAINMQRLLLQIARQTASAWQGSETLADLTPITLLFAVWALTGVALAPRRIRFVLMGCLLPYILVVPWFARHYGALDPARFTTFMVPVLAAGMGLLAEQTMIKLAQRTGQPANASAPKATRHSNERGNPGITPQHAYWIPVPAFARDRLFAGMTFEKTRVALIIVPILLAFSANSIYHLSAFYIDAEPTTLNGATLNDLSSEMVRLNAGEPVYIGLSDAMLNIRGQPRVPIGFATMARIGIDFIPIDEVLRRLYEFPGPATLMLANVDAERVRQIAPLSRLQTTATERAQQHGYGLFVRDPARAMLKPEFVRAGDVARSLAPQVRIGASVGAGLELIGYDPPAQPKPGSDLAFTLYWRRTAPMPIAQYMGFVHVVDAANAKLVAQKDQRLGADRYPVNGWQADEVIVEQYVFGLPKDSPPGEYAVRAGAYTFPDLQRLAVPGSADSIVQLPALNVTR